MTESVTVRFVAAALVLGIVGAGHPQQTLAQNADEQARQNYDDGRVAYEDGQFETALGHFQKAYDLVRKPELLFNLASCYDRLNNLKDAISHYEAYLQAVEDAPNESYVRSRVIILQRQLDKEESARAAIENEKKVQQDAQRQAKANEQKRQSDHEGQEEGGSRVGPITLLAIGGVAVVTAAITGPLALTKRDELGAQCMMDQCDIALLGQADEIRTLSIITDIAIVTAAVAITAGLLWWVLSGSDDSKKDPPAKKAMLGGYCTDAGCGLSLAGKF